MKRRHVPVLVIYSILTLVLTYPLVLQFNSHVPGTETWSLDEYGFVWAQWWFKHSLFDLGINPYSTGMVFYPLGMNLSTFTMLWLHDALGLPVQLAFGLIPASNTMVVFSFVASAFGMFVLTEYLLRVSFKVWRERNYRSARWITRDSPTLVTLAAFAAGIVYGFSSNRLVYTALGHYTQTASEWFPFYLLFLIKTILNARVRDAVLAGLLAALALLSELTFAPLLALLTVIVVLFEWRYLTQFKSLTRLALVAVSGIAFSAILLIPAFAELAFSGYSLPGWGHAENLLVDLNGFFSMTSLHPLNRFWVQELDQVRQGIARFSDVNTFFVGYATALAALVGAAVYFRNVRVWIAVVLVFAVLTMGPLLHINGVSEFDLDGLTVTIPLPFLAIHYIPLLRENRAPNRYSILVVLGLAILVSYGAYWLMTRLARNPRGEVLTGGLVCALISALFLFEHLAIPLPLTDARPPDIYNTLRAEPGEFTILTLPLGWRNSFGQVGAEDTRVMYYQSAHGKDLLGGNTSRNPPFLFDYFQRLPVLSSIIALETYQPVDDATMKRDRQLAGDLMSFLNVRYLVVHPAIPGRPPYSDTRNTTLEYLQKVLPLGDKVYDREGVVAYRVNAPPIKLPIEVDFGTTNARMYQGEGWLSDESVGGASANWASRQDTRLLLSLRDKRDYQLVVRALPFSFPDSPPQWFQLTFNGQVLPRTPMRDGWNEYTISLPAEAVESGMNTLDLNFAYVDRPRDVLPPNYEIGATGVKSPVDIAVQSTAAFGSIKINGQERSPLKRGYNLAVLDPHNGKLTDVKNFDTGGTRIQESRALRDFVSKIPDGMVVLGAVQEEASASLGEAAATTIQSLGLKANLRGQPGATHAFIAVKGMPGALEQTGTGPSAVSVGHSLDDRTLGIAVDWIRVQ